MTPGLNPPFDKAAKFTLGLGLESEGEAACDLGKVLVDESPGFISGFLNWHHGFTYDPELLLGEAASSFLAAQP